MRFDINKANEKKEGGETHLEIYFYILKFGPRHYFSEYHSFQQSWERIVVSDSG